jgi:hypothetical protein
MRLFPAGAIGKSFIALPKRISIQPAWYYLSGPSGL